MHLALRVFVHHNHAPRFFFTEELTDESIERSLQSITLVDGDSEKFGYKGWTDRVFSPCGLENSHACRFIKNGLNRSHTDNGKSLNF